MGYRHYFNKMDKEKLDDIKNLSFKEIQQLLNKDEYMGIHEILGPTLFEFGKMYWCDTAERIYETGTPMFENKETQDWFSDYHPYVVGKEGLLKAIEVNKEKVLAAFESYKEDKEGLEKYNLDKIERIDWIYDIDEKSNKVAGTWYYEYELFNLIHLLKTINWEKETIVFLGW